MKTIIQLYDHLNWANTRILQTLGNLEQKNQQASRLFVLTDERENVIVINEVKNNLQGLKVNLN